MHFQPSGQGRPRDGRAVFAGNQADGGKVDWLISAGQTEPLFAPASDGIVGAA